MGNLNKKWLYIFVGIVIVVVTAIFWLFLKKEDAGQQTALTPEEIEEQRILKEINEKLKSEDNTVLPSAVLPVPPAFVRPASPSPPQPRLPGSKYAVPKDVMLKYIQDGSGKTTKK